MKGVGGVKLEREGGCGVRKYFYSPAVLLSVFVVRILAYAILDRVTLTSSQCRFNCLKSIMTQLQNSMS